MSGFPSVALRPGKNNGIRKPGGPPLALCLPPTTISVYQEASKQTNTVRPYNHLANINNRLTHQPNIYSSTPPTTITNNQQSRWVSSTTPRSQAKAPLPHKPQCNTSRDQPLAYETCMREATCAGSKRATRSLAADKVLASMRRGLVAPLLLSTI